MILLVLAILLTLGISAFCSLAEAMLLSTTLAEIEALKNQFPKRGFLLEKFRLQLEETSSAILVLNTIANIAGAALVAGLANHFFGDHSLIYFTIGMTLGILIFSEIIPKNIGVIYRVSLQYHLIFSLWIIRWIMMPISWLCKNTVYCFMKEKNKLENSDEEIILLAKRSAKEGTLSKSESEIITNTLSLDDIRLKNILTPRTVVAALEGKWTIDKVFQSMSSIPFSRLPVYDNSIDNTIGIVKRYDLLTAKANGQNNLIIKQFIYNPIFLPKITTGDGALKNF